MFEAARLAVYVVTSGADAAAHVEMARAAIAGGATAIQVRTTGLTEEPARVAALAIAVDCARAGVLCIVNDDVDLAVAASADGAHVGQDDRPLEARGVLGPTRVLGVSVGSAEEALEAERCGADYLGVTVWSTATKPEARPIGLEGLAAIAATTALPVVGIGGIHAGNAADVIAAGAAGVAVISAVAGSIDPVEATRELVRTVEGASR